MKNYNFIYILGRGHSGSTMLDTVLGNHIEIESVGELIAGLTHFNRGICSCGVPILDCEYWQSVVKNYNEIDFDFFRHNAVQQAHVRNFMRYFLFGKRNSELLNQNIDFTDVISEISNKNYVLDSSKEPTRALLLSGESQNLVIHLVRNPVSVVSSTYFRIKKGSHVQFLRKKFIISGVFIPLYVIITAVSWSIGNFLAELIKFKNGKNVITVRYEDFIMNPNATLQSIGDELNLDMSELSDNIEKQREFLVGHNVGGNHFRFKKKFKVDVNRKSREMPRHYSFIVKFINLPFILYYRYNIWK